jgi:hypothetical protein
MDKDIDKLNAEVDASMSDLRQHFVKLKMGEYLERIASEPTATEQFCKWKEFEIPYDPAIETSKLFEEYLTSRQ